MAGGSQNQPQPGLPGVHEVLEDSAGPELVQLSDHTDPHVPVPPQQPGDVFAVTCDREHTRVWVLFSYCPAGGAAA